MSGNKVLVIEDDKIFSGIIHRYLSQRGYLVVEAEDGETGLALCASEQPDIVICDLKLPRLSGLQVLEKLIFSMVSTPVIVISASERLADIREAVRLGAWDYLVKPIAQLDVLDHAIQNCLSRSNLEQVWERERWELDDHIDVLFQNDELIEQLSNDLLPHESIQLPCCEIKHHLGAQDGTHLMIDYHRFPGDSALVVMAHSQATAGQNVLALLVLKSLLNAFVRKGLAGHDGIMRKPERLLEMLNAEICHSRMRSAYDMVALWVDGTTGAVSWAHCGDGIDVSTDSRSDLALGIWAQAKFTSHTGKLSDEPFILSAFGSKVSLTRRR